MTGRPFFIHIAGVIAISGFPVSRARRSEIVTIYTFAVEPICVPFPPIPTPIASDHHNGETLIPCVSRPRIIGIIAAVKGMLSMAAESTADTHISIMDASNKSL